MHIYIYRERERHTHRRCRVTCIRLSHPPRSRLASVLRSLCPSFLLSFLTPCAASFRACESYATVRHVRSRLRLLFPSLAVPRTAAPAQVTTACCQFTSRERLPAVIARRTTIPRALRQPSASSCSRLRLLFASRVLSERLARTTRALGVAVQGLGLDRCGHAAPFLLWPSCSSRCRGLLHSRPITRCGTRSPAACTVASPVPLRRLSLPSSGLRRVQVHRHTRLATDAAACPRALCASLRRPSTHASRPRHDAAASAFLERRCGSSSSGERAHEAIRALPRAVPRCRSTTNSGDVAALRPAASHQCTPRAALRRRLRPPRGLQPYAMR